jgi:muramoyltetrapeptide carboxypeptidase
VKAERLERGLAALAALGFEPVVARNLGARHDLFAGTAAERLDAFHELAADESIAAILFARGGEGALALLPELDWSLLARRPRAYVGYSDLTPLLLEIPRRLGFATFHGPMVAADFARGLEPEERVSFLAALAGEWPQIVPASTLVRVRDQGEPVLVRVRDQSEPVLVRVRDQSETVLADGAALEPVEGPLVGGCLSLLTALLGTPWRPDFDGAIVLLEEVAEPSYRLDRMLTHLALSGSLAGVRGVVLGEFEGIDVREGGYVRAIERVARAVPGRAVLGGAPIGHVGPNRTVPLGLSARLDPAQRTLTVGAGAIRR